MKIELNGAGGCSPEEISEVVSRYRSGGVSLAEFARQEGIPRGRLHYWIYQKPAGASGRRPAKRTQAVASPAFQEVKLSRRPEWNCSWAAEVGLPEGIEVRFSARASAEWIGAVVQALRRPC
jgi:transposase-like protein